MELTKRLWVRRRICSWINTLVFSHLVHKTRNDEGIETFWHACIYGLPAWRRGIDSTAQHTIINRPTIQDKSGLFGFCGITHQRDGISQSRIR
jgi:hypothetical protein